MDGHGGQAREQALRELGRGLWATIICFVIGAAAGTAVLWGAARPFAGDGSVIIPAAAIAGIIAAGAFVTSTLMHRRGETGPMPPWQAVVSDLSSVALTLAFAAVTGLGVLLAGEVLAAGLHGLELPPLGGGVLVGVASAVGGRPAFRAGIRLRTRDIAGLLSGFLVIGTLFAMITATDPGWWERNFSQLGIGAGAWAFNGTLIIAGLLVATVGSYLGRDLHRMLGDDALPRIAGVVAAWAASGAALAAVGLLPIDTLRPVHTIAAIAAVVLLVLAAVLTASAMPEAPGLLRAVTVGLVVLVAVSAALAMARVYSVTVLESIVTGLALLWLSTLVQVVGVLAPDASRPSARRSPLR
ncbi:MULTISPECIES: DUF998 domain-containing protein [Microbacterium]|uniref:DUF998 domain-containing protein n=1 Tax=Microbacterium TaxID=33882 RepID=UPI00217E0020|nr:MULTISPECIES: DUF998 domain-containing protein [Microbacterium]UWF77638.1 DUF998 domain-containing protein [Microbacterium neungamense]WCM55808.1 DUF998 domain-containing protein [Microbacterium sp. EF45047]